MIRKAYRTVLRCSGWDLRRIRTAVIELQDADELRKLYRWTREPILDDASVYQVEHEGDVNERRVRDAQTLATVVRNIQPSVCVDIGTSTGHSAACMAVNAPQARVFTVNIPPEDLQRGEGGDLTTVALDRSQIGAYYRERQLGNIEQILANTAHWEPDLGPIDVAFIDGCHDTDFVYHDSCKMLSRMKSGAFLLWHDFNLDLVNQYPWIHSVCRGVEKLYQHRHLRGRIYHVRDSWTGIYRVP